MIPVFDARVAVVGAGPAGLAAAVAAADAGAKVVLIDAEPAPGGQFWRIPTGADPDRRLYHGLSRYRSMVAALHRHRVDGRLRTLFGHEVWAAERTERIERTPARTERPADGFALHATGPGPQTRPSDVTVRARNLVLAPGAYDLQVPFPGWHLPGVLTAGGVQSLLKGHGVVAGRRVAVAGTGPFLLPVAAGLAMAGARVVGVYEAAAPGSAGRLVRPGLRLPGKALEAAGYAVTLVRHQVGYHPRSAVLAAHGRDEVEAVTVARLDADGSAVNGTQRQIAVDTLAVGWGFTARLELPLALGCSTTITTDGAMSIVVDENQATDQPGIFVAGEACGIGGADLALVEGAIAGTAAAATTPPAVPGRWLAERARLRAFAAALLDAYPVPPGWMDRIDDDTLVCRCEEVTAGTLRRAAEGDDVADARSAKLFTRVGMGRCQGRVCGYAASCLTARWSGRPVEWQPATRPITTPVPLGMIAEMAEDPGPE